MSKKMLHLKTAVQHIFEQIDALLSDLSDEQYSTAGSRLLNATIGQHVRHIIELFIELDKGYVCGVVNYENRKRDHRIETDKYFAASLLSDIINALEKNDKALLLEAGFDNNTGELLLMDTNYYRELAYNIEHTIHHMALIRVGVNELCALQVNENFGIAPATIKYRNACVQ